MTGLGNGFNQTRRVMINLANLTSDELAIETGQREWKHAVWDKAVSLAPQLLSQIQTFRSAIGPDGFLRVHGSTVANSGGVPYAGVSCVWYLSLSAFQTNCAAMSCLRLILIPFFSDGKAVPLFRMWLTASVAGGVNGDIPIQTPSANIVKDKSSKSLYAYLDFDSADENARIITLRIATSFLSSAQADISLQREVGNATFEAVMAESKAVVSLNPEKQGGTLAHCDVF